MKKLYNIANSTSALSALKFMTFGAELEFQRGGDDFDSDGFYEYQRECWDECDDRDDYISRSDREEYRCLRNLSDFESDYLSTKALERLIELEDDAFDNYRESTDWSGEIARFTEKNEVELPPDWELGDDSSVPDGGEIRSLGGLRGWKLLQDIKDIFTDNPSLEIDVGCSFHIHVKADEITHSYGKELQAEMIAYLMQQYNNFPVRVKERLRTHKIKYCKLHVSTDKFTAVHFHAARDDKPATWEFRLWGNVATGRDARRCLLLTAAALRHAYRVKLGIDRSLIHKLGHDEFAEICLDVVNAPTTTYSVRAKTARKQRYDSERNAA
jgi:hypothetical protein